jgi:regulation of enolase protein 1 (concanavalin A-like superfamily)
MFVSPGRGLAFQRRAADGAESTHTSGGAGTAPRWVRLVRSGNAITASASIDGTIWTLAGTDTIGVGETIYVGLAVSSHDDTRLCTATFDSVFVSGS